MKNAKEQKLQLNKSIKFKFYCYNKCLSVHSFFCCHCDPDPDKQHRQQKYEWTDKHLQKRKVAQRPSPQPRSAALPMGCPGVLRPDWIYAPSSGFLVCSEVLSRISPQGGIHRLSVEIPESPQVALFIAKKQWFYSELLLLLYLSSSRYP